jgi:hypothetical protein
MLFSMAAPSIDTIYDTLIDYADFEEVASVSRAKTFVTAAKRYLLAAPSNQSDQGSSMALSVAQIENILKRALDFISTNDTSTSASRVSFLSAGRGFR